MLVWRQYDRERKRKEKGRERKDISQSQTKWISLFHSAGTSEQICGTDVLNTTHLITPLRVMRTLKGDYYIYVVCQVQSNVPFFSSPGTKRNNRYAHSIHIGWLVGSQTPNPNNGGSWFDAHILHPSTTHQPFRHIWKEHSEKGYI
jgi:hypothetical protein